MSANKNSTALRAVRISVLNPGGIAATPLVSAVLWVNIYSYGTKKAALLWRRHRPHN